MILRVLTPLKFTLIAALVVGMQSENLCDRVCLVGSGNWGSAIARIVGRNVFVKKGFVPEIKMWVYEEEIEGRKLTDIINKQHENVKYLPGYQLPKNVVAEPDLRCAVRDASILIFVVPHQFLPKLLPVIRKELPSDISRIKAISLIKAFDCDESGLVLISDQIRDGLGGQVDVSVLMGANVANEVAEDMFCEATLGYRSLPNAEILKELFDCVTFRVALTPDPEGVEVFALCRMLKQGMGGDLQALKNIVALAAGFCDGLGYGSNTKAAVIRIGLVEMLHFAQTFFHNVKVETLLESCGVADAITTCFNGRNRRCAEAFAAARRGRLLKPKPVDSVEILKLTTATAIPDSNGGAGPGPTWEELERQMLGGQQLAGPPACEAVHRMLCAKGLGAKFPLLETIYEVSFEQLPPEEIVARAGAYY